MAFSPLSTFGAEVATASHDGLVETWNVASAIAAHPFSGRAPSPRGLAFTSDGALLIVAEDDGTIHVWSALARPGEPLVTLRAVAQHDAGVAISIATGTLQAELLGSEVEVAAGELMCRIGPLSFPFDLCRERAETHGLLARALVGETPEDEP